MAKKRGSKIKTVKRGEMDFVMFFTVLVLMVIGLSILFSASSAANMLTGNVYGPIIKQSVLALVGVVMMLVLSRMNYETIRIFVRLAYLVNAALMMAVPLIGMASHGAKRQIDLGFISFQPSEFSKYVLIFWLADRFARLRRDGIKKWSEVFSELIIIGIPVFECVALQSHMSAAIIHMAVGFVMMLSAGAELRKLIPIGLAAGVAMVFLAIFTKYRSNRILSFLGLGESDAQGSDWQSNQSIYAVGSGGLFGLGLGNSRQKYSYLSEAENDFIFAIVGEELGFIGAFLVVLLFCVLIWRGILTAANCKNAFGAYTAFGITVLIGLQMAVNMGVVLKLLPVTGMQLPLFSSGGTSMLITMAGFGVLLSISRDTYRKRDTADEEQKRLTGRESYNGA